MGEEAAVLEGLDRGEAPREVGVWMGLDWQGLLWKGPGWKGLRGDWSLATGVDASGEVGACREHRGDLRR